MAADKTITCRDCATQFIFSVREQEFFAEKGFGDPVRCVACRRALKAKRQEGDGAGAPGGGPQAQRPAPAGGENRPRWSEERPRREGGGRPPYQGRDFDRGPRGDRRPPMAEPAPQSSAEDEFPELRPNYRAEPVFAGGGDAVDRRERPRGFSDDYPSRRQREKRSTRPRYEDTGDE